MNRDMFNASNKINPNPDSSPASSSFLSDYGRELVVVAVMVGLVFSNLTLPEWLPEVTIEEKEALLAAVFIPETKPLPVPPPDPYVDLELGAKAAIVFDMTTDTVLFEKNPHISLPLASITKLMTSLLVDELLSPDAIITIGIEAIKTDGDSGFLVGEKFVRQDLSDLTLVTSSNDGAYALAEAAGNTLIPGSGVSAFVEAMNIRAREIGLNHTEFSNPTGLDENETQSGNLGTVVDIAKLLNYIIAYNPSILEATTKEQIRITNTNGAAHAISNTNHDVINIPGLLGSKTGFTELAGGNLAIVYNAGLRHPIAIVVLGSSLGGRFSDVETLVSLTNKQFVN